MNVPEKNPARDAEQPEGVDPAVHAEQAENPAQADGAARVADAAQVDDAARVEDAAQGDGDPAAEEGRPEDGGTSLYVRRGRTPTLGFWVALAIAVPAVAALLSAPLFAFADIGGVLNFVLLAAVFVGLPLAAIAAFVDSRRHRSPRSRRR